MQRQSLTQQRAGKVPSPLRHAKRRSPCTAVKAELTADRPRLAPALGQQQQPEASISTSSCPFLAGLTPPVVKLPLHKRFQQLFDPQQFQRSMLQDAQGSMVQAPAQIGFTNFYMPATADMIKEAFSGELNGTTKQAQIPSFVGLMGDDSLIIVQDPKHKYLRGLLQPAFTKEAIATYIPSIQDLVASHLAEWEAAGEAGVKGYDKLKLMTVDYILRVTMGSPYTRQQILELNETYQKWTMGFLAWPWLNIPFTPFAGAMKAKQQLLDHFQEATAAARQRMAAGQEVPGVIGSLVAAVDEEGNRLTDKEICENVLLLLLAGHDTSSTTLTQCMSNLQDHPAIVEKLRAEQKAVLAKHGEQLTAAALNDMKYADAVIRETLRRNPVVSGLFRVAAKDINMGGYTVPKDMPLLLPLHHVAATDERWVQQTGDLAPAVFNPDRMMSEEGGKPGAQMPFGYGPRYCIGAALAMAEMKVFLALLARHYSFSVDNNTQWKQAVGRVPENGLPIVLKQLTQS